MSYFTDSRYVTELSPSDFDGINVGNLKDGKCAIVLFYAPWCPYCKRVKDTWEQLGELASFYNVFAFDCEKYKAHVMDIKNDVPELIKGYPTMIVYQGGVPKEKVGMTEEDRTVSVLAQACLRVCGDD